MTRNAQKSFVYDKETFTESFEALNESLYHIRKSVILLLKGDENHNTKENQDIIAEIFDNNLLPQNAQYSLNEERSKSSMEQKDMRSELLGHFSKYKEIINLRSDLYGSLGEVHACVNKIIPLETDEIKG